jgi:hypothetical protein
MQITFNPLSSLNLDDEVYQKISLNLGKIASGSDQSLRSPLGSSLSSSQILSGWDDIFNSRLESISEELLALEVSNRSKFGPRSIAVPWVERRDGVLDYYSPDNCPKLDSQYALSLLSPRLRPLSLIKASKFIKNNTSSGLPFMVRKGLVKDICLENFDYYLSRQDPSVLFTRTQEDKKTRTVWGYPLADIINETRFYRPLLEYQKKLAWRSSLVSPDKVNSRLTFLISKARENKSLILSSDFTAYDASLKLELQKACFSYIKALFQPEYNSEIDYIMERFSSIDLVTPDGIAKGLHGVPSGSTFTNEVDSICQYLIASSVYGRSEGLFDIQGDDAVYVTSDPTKLKSEFRKRGLSINDEKSYINSSSAIYLQCLHSTDYVNHNGEFAGIYPTYRAINRIIHPERYDKYSDYAIEGSDFNSIRAISILENCRYHPLFKDLVKYVFLLDKYSLRYSQSGLKKYIKRISETSGIEGVFSYRSGDDVKGLASFETVKVLQSL